MGAKGPEIEFPKIASVFLYSVCIFNLELTVLHPKHPEHFPPSCPAEVTADLETLCTPHTIELQGREVSWV